ncbi:ATPase P [Ktedonosporobacter rubrisoli]|uniref:ATPase P n=1 Tax=Ktedonosporobacter rubrisoli TaxID=2509675 RepID=A0A4P6K5A9_KTERU|nr:ATPase P [Ktedonosporobacter rubrisoli]
MRIEIPQRGTIELQHAVFDINGTLAVDGIAIPEVADRLSLLAPQISLHFLTAGTHGNQAGLERTLGFPLHTIHKGDEKMRYVQQLGPSHVVAVGNGINDCAMLRLAVLGIAVLGKEGLATRTWQAADILVQNPLDALDLLLQPKRLIATLRG